MRFLSTRFGAALALAAGLCSTAALAQTQEDVNAHINAAKAAAQFDFLGTLARLCLTPPDVKAINDTAPGPAPARDTWFTEPAKVFDNLYFVGSKIHSSWALVDPAGIILLDTLYTYNSPEEIGGGLRKLGFEPKNVKYTIISHAHGDHVGGAKMMQDFGSRVIMGDADWASIEKSVNGYPSGKPKRDITATDSQVVTVGNTSVTIITTPGHTPGTLSFIFPVKDNGVPKTVAYSGGTAFNFVTAIPNFDIYIASQRKMAAAAKAANATIIMSNHSEFDSATTKIKLIAARKPGDPHPFELGAEAVKRYFTVSDECAQASEARLRMLPAK